METSPTDRVRAPSSDGATSADEASSTDEGFMARAVALAGRGRATVRPNPMVGCVLVRDGEIVGEGWHGRAGGPHAEVVALDAAGDRARGATAYVTLEPCCHTGRTGPCTTALLEAGVREVVYAAADPAHGGADTLRAAGVEVRGGVLAERAEEQNEEFLHVVRVGRPFVTVKIAQSLDGRVAARDGSSRWITGAEARAAGHALRARVDGVLVGSGTVLADDPALTVRHVEAPLGQPRAVVLDARGRTPPSARVARPGTVVLTTASTPDRWRADLTDAGTEVQLLEPGADGGVDLGAALATLLDLGLTRLLLEGGPTLAGAFLRAGFVDRLVVHLAPSLLGADALPSIAGPGAASVSDRWDLELVSVEPLGQDLELVARPRRS